MEISRKDHTALVGAQAAARAKHAAFSRAAAASSDHDTVFIMRNLAVHNHDVAHALDKVLAGATVAEDGDR